ncbi:hypothetical protein EOD39_18807 [Acipenser ruthenus]|uniref:Ig-like domain-containing protein n=1 Tax=Acipenser ruthenus TaxID=7906 RepID=A0A444UZT4_ACIRT|nr:hypothetical protein EOD39_18807 [Acipenser ruthenus]
MTIQNMMYNDSGGYQCRVFGTELNTSNMGHMTNVTVTAVSSKEPCVPSVIAKRSFTSIPVGGALSLNCSVIHCGPGSWSGEWGRSDVGNFNPLNLSDDRVQVTVIPVRETQTTLQLTIQNMMYNDSGEYQCRVIGTELNISNMGHKTNVTVTAQTTDSEEPATEVSLLTDHLISFTAKTPFFNLSRYPSARLPVD